MCLRSVSYTHLDVYKRQSTHRQMSDEQLKEAGVPAELIRISCGIEDKRDLIADLAQALDAI